MYTLTAETLGHTEGLCLYQRQKKLHCFLRSLSQILFALSTVSLILLCNLQLSFPFILCLFFNLFTKVLSGNQN